MRNDRHRSAGRRRAPRTASSEEPPELVLTLSTGPDDGFVVHARSLQGETQAPFRLPWTRHEGLALGRTLRRCHRHVVSAAGEGGEAPPPLDLRREGGRLFEALFADAGVRGLYRDARAADPEGRARLRLVLDPDLPGSAPLHRVPWEILFDPERGELLALAAGLSLARTLMVPRPPRGFERRRRLRVLVVLSGAGDLDLERERRQLEGVAGRSRGLEVACVPAAGLDGLEALLAEAERTGRPFHLLHLAGHGEVAAGPEGGVLVWEPPGGTAERVTGRRLSTLLRRFPELQLVVLNACSTAELPADGADAFAGVAAALLQGGVPVVVAVQGAIRDDAAIDFARTFYGALADGGSPDEAMAAARWALWKPDPAETEWLKPVLFRGAPRPGRPRWLVWAAALLAVAALGVSLVAAVQTHRLATRTVEQGIQGAQSLLLDDRPAEAARTLETALARTAWPPVARQLRAAAHATAAVAAEDLGDLADAVEHAAAAARLEPGRAIHHYNLGALLARSGRPGEAAPPLRRALELDPALADAANELGFIHLELGRPAAALEVLEAAAASHPDHPLVHKNLGRALLELGRHGEAARSLDRALALLPLGHWPARAEASFWRARAAAGEGDAPGACEAIAGFRAADPQAVTRFAPDAARLASATGCPALSGTAGGPRAR